VSGFSVSWLDLREAADHAARDAGLGEAAGRFLRDGPGAVVDLGGGTGSTFRALGGSSGPLLHGHPCRLVDLDAGLLAEATARDPAIAAHPADLSGVDDLPIGDARLVTASALLDLVSADWLHALARRLSACGAGLYAALTYDGRMAFSPPHPLDGAVTAAFNRHQRGDKGFGPALGPDAAEAAAGILRASGFSVTAATSDWRLGSADAALARPLVEGIAAAAGEAGLGPDEAAGWLAFRLAHLAGGEILVGHRDLLALPPADGQTDDIEAGLREADAGEFASEEDVARIIERYTGRRPEP